MISGSRLDELLDQWEDALARGEMLSAEQLCANCPELKEPLSEQIAALQRIREKFDSLSQASQQHGQQHMVAEPTNVPQLPVEEGSVSVMTSVEQMQLYATGGLGRVFSGTDTVLHRDVAVKFLQEQHATRPRMMERFVAEAEITSRLDHPNVVPVHGFGWTAAGHPFYVMRLIRGESLDAEIDRFHSKSIRSVSAFRSSEFRNLLQRIKDTCNAIAYAHSRGIVHLDIKPQNILIGKYGETMVVDWGLAATVGREDRFRMNGEQTLNLKMSASNSSTSMQGGGTPAYMSPEQVVWQPPPGPPADLFCLGATLYKICTGRPPYRGSRQPKVIDQNLAIDYPLPREIQKHVPRALQSICLKAMAMQPEKRYETALELAADLDRYLGGARVKAHQEGIAERVGRYINQHRRSSAFAATFAVLLLIASVVSSVRFAEIARREAASRAAVEQLQSQTLAASAHYAAEMFAGEIQYRWTVLDRAATSKLLRDELQKFANGNKDEVAKEQLQVWLSEQFVRYRDLNASSWFIVAGDGTQLVVVPRRRSGRSESEGVNFRHRDYFHGRGREFDRNTPADELPPIRAPHFSAPYVSTNSSKLRVALSVPIWADEDGSGAPLGVLGMGTELGQMKMLENAILIDSRPDWLEENEEVGLVLQHPALERENLPVGKTGRDFFRVTPQQLSEMSVAGRSSRLLPKFIDPLSADGQEQIAAAAPVVVNDWLAPENQQQRNTGLYIVVTQPNLPTVEAGQSPETK